MNVTKLRDRCRKFPGATEQIQWGEDLVFKVGGKMFCVTCPTSHPSQAVVVSFKCSAERFAELCEREGVIPAPYLARAQWVALERWDALEDREIVESVTAAYEIVRAKLPRKVQDALPAIGEKRAKPGAARTAAKPAATAGRSSSGATTSRGTRR